MATKLQNRFFLKQAFLLLEAELAIAILLTLVIISVSSLNHLLKAQRESNNYLSALLVMDEKLSKIQAYGMNQTIEDDEGQESDFTWSYNEIIPEDISNITQLELKVSWDRKPRAGSFSVNTFIVNE